MRYEKPECVLLGAANTIVLGGTLSLDPEHVMSSKNADLVGYDE